MRLLLVNCLNFDEGLRYSENSGEHLGVLYLISSLRRHFSDKELQVKVSYSLSDLILKEFKPDVVGLSTVSQNYYVAQKYAKLCKDYGAAVIIGGVHISTLPHTLTKQMDVGVINEGEETIVELMKVFMEESCFPKNKLAEIKGIIFYDEDNIAKTQPREQIKNLDTLPVPAREFYYHPKRGIFTSRGCPYDCVFCFSKPFWGKPRFFSAEYVIKEVIEVVEKFNVSKVAFYDDLFIANLPRFKKIVQYIREAGLHKKVAFSCAVRPNLVTDKVASLLKSMNVTNVFMGIESGNERILKYLKKQACSVQQNYDAVRILRKHKIITDGGFIIGSPDETKEEIMDTLRFIRKSKIDHCSPLLLTPLPGTPVWELAKKRGLVSDHMDWNILREEFNEITDKHIILSETLSREELYNLYKKFKREQKRKLLLLSINHPLFAVQGMVRLIKRQSHYLRIFSKERTQKG
jgi:radical SAM superfamily enzyme YgiQ (UPF0313 family)